MFASVPTLPRVFIPVFQAGNPIIVTARYFSVTVSAVARARRAAGATCPPYLLRGKVLSLRQFLRLRVVLLHRRQCLARGFLQRFIPSRGDLGLKH